MKPVIAVPGFLFAAESSAEGFGIILLHMDPGHQLRIRIFTSADDPCGRPFQIGDLNVVTLPHTQPVQLPWAQQLHPMAVSGDHPGRYRPVMHIRFQKLLVHPTPKEGRDGNIKFCPVQIVDQIHQHLLGTAMTKIMDEKKDLFHKANITFWFCTEQDSGAESREPGPARRTEGKHFPSAQPTAFWP